MKQLLLVILGLFAIVMVKAQESAPDTTPFIRPEINLIAKEMVKDNVVKSGGVGAAGARTTQWERYEQISQQATTRELISLTNHANGVVRCYAFQALLKRPDANHFEILLMHLTDTTMVETFMGCIISSEMVGDYFIDIASPAVWIFGSDTINPIPEQTYSISKQQQVRIDSILLFNPSIRLSAKYSLLRTLHPDIKHYERVREIALTETSPLAILALSRYKNPNDINIITSLFAKENTEYYAAYCAREYPDSSFYPLLGKMFEREWSNKYYDYPKLRILYQALSKYPTEPTYKLYERTIECKDKFRYQTLGTYLMIAITKYPDKLYKPLRSKIKLDEFHKESVKQQMDAEP